MPRKLKSTALQPNVVHLPGMASSEDAYGYWGTIGSPRFYSGVVNVKMVR